MKLFPYTVIKVLFLYIGMIDGVREERVNVKNTQRGENAGIL